MRFQNPLMSGVARMAGCKRPCTVAYHGDQKASYLFGDIEAESDMADLIRFAKQYAHLSDGWCSGSDRPGKLRKATLFAFSPSHPAKGRWLMSSAHLEVQIFPGRQDAAIPSCSTPTNFALEAENAWHRWPNGAGKTTLLRLLYRFHRPVTGTVRVGGTDIWALSARETARRIAAVLQEQPSDFALSVQEIVALGRTPHGRGFAGSSGAHDRQTIADALIALAFRVLRIVSWAPFQGGGSALWLRVP